MAAKGGTIDNILNIHCIVMSQDALFVSPPSSLSAAASLDANSAHLQPSQLRLPFFVYGTLCTGFVNWEHFIKVTPPGAHIRDSSLFFLENISTLSNVFDTVCSHGIFKLVPHVLPVTLLLTSPREVIRVCTRLPPRYCQSLVAAV